DAGQFGVRGGVVEGDPAEVAAEVGGGLGCHGDALGVGVDEEPAAARRDDEDLRGPGAEYQAGRAGQRLPVEGDAVVGGDDRAGGARGEAPQGRLGRLVGV